MHIYIYYWFLKFFFFFIFQNAKQKIFGDSFGNRYFSFVYNRYGYILYIELWGFHCRMLETITNGASDPRCPGQTCLLFKFRQPDDLFHTLKTVKGLLRLVPSRTPQSSGMMFHVHEVYVTCYFCYMFSLGPSSASTGSVQIYRNA